MAWPFTHLSMNAQLVASHHANNWQKHFANYLLNIKLKTSAL